ncbi:Veg family protein [Candidatus Oleimmundimicrobium sp.]|uniref:Veg family protein n=1 Tax=Candidatus Oleimmundimicrobium sp. TaxID=3060597 RepID=UPI002715CE28|nr:Veg family protein [Candidatus Oleimmundimicrobium sp.]MDO8886306.1 Veg family protein [Candidatus Oleimmundimicrobium sp.]
MIDVELPKIEIVSKIKMDLESYLGGRMKLRANVGRCKIIEREGVLKETHPNLFIVKVEEEERTRLVSYSYVDVLTKTVELTNPVNGENIVSWLQ